MTIYIKNKHTLQIEDFHFKCVIGKKDLLKKIEGDKTPVVFLAWVTYIIGKIELKFQKPKLNVLK